MIAIDFEKQSSLEIRKGSERAVLFIATESNGLRKKRETHEN